MIKYRSAVILTYIAIIIASLAIITSLFSVHSALLSSLKSNSDAAVYLLFNHDIYQYHLAISGWKFAYPTFLLPKMVLNLFFGLFLAGFYPSVAVIITVAILFPIFSYWILSCAFAQTIQTKWHIALYVVLITTLIFTILQYYPIAEPHYGTLLISFLFVGATLQYINKPNKLLLIFILLLNILSIYSDLLCAISCVIPFTIALFIFNLTNLKFDKTLTKLMYWLTISTFIGGLAASYLRLVNYSIHAFFTISLFSIIFAIIISPLRLLPKFKFDQYRSCLKRICLVFSLLSIALLLYILFSHAFYQHFRHVILYKLHFSMDNTAATNKTFFSILKTMLTTMLFAKPISLTIWFKLFLLTPVLAGIYLLFVRRPICSKKPIDFGLLLAWFLIMGVTITLAANVFGVGLQTFNLEKFYNIRYFIIPIFFSLIIIGFAFFNLFANWLRLFFSIACLALLTSILYSPLHHVNFNAYANQNAYKKSINAEIQCIYKTRQSQHLHYGLADHFLSLIINEYLPRSTYLNQITPDGKIWHVMNNIYWYVYNPINHNLPIYNFIITPGKPSSHPEIMQRFGHPDKTVNCGENIYLALYQKRAALKKLNVEIYRQAMHDPLVANFMRKKFNLDDKSAISQIIKIHGLLRSG